MRFPTTFRTLSAALLAAGWLASGALADTMGDDGLHKAAWMHDTFKDLREDLADANAEGKRLMVLVEQRGCIYCKKMHEEVFPVPDIAETLTDRYYVIQVNMFGDTGMTDFDGEELSEKELVQKWGLLFTPTMVFFPEEVPENTPGNRAAVATMPGAFGKWTTLNLLNWVLEHGYDGDEPFQKYHARMIATQQSE